MLVLLNKIKINLFASTPLATNRNFILRHSVRKLHNVRETSLRDVGFARALTVAVSRDWSLMLIFYYIINLKDDNNNI